MRRLPPPDHFDARPPEWQYRPPLQMPVRRTHLGRVRRFRLAFLFTSRFRNNRLGSASVWNPQPSRQGSPPTAGGKLKAASVGGLFVQTRVVKRKLQGIAPPRQYLIDHV